MSAPRRPRLWVAEIAISSSSTANVKTHVCRPDDGRELLLKWAVDPTIDDSRTGRPTTEVIAEHNRYKTRRRDPRGANPALPRVVWLQVREMFDADRPRPELAPLLSLPSSPVDRPPGALLSVGTVNCCCALDVDH